MDADNSFSFCPGQTAFARIVERFALEGWFGPEIQQQTNCKARCFQIVQELRFVFPAQFFCHFKFDYNKVTHDQIGFVVSNLSPLVNHFNRNLLSDSQTQVTCLDCHRVFVNISQEPLTQFVVNVVQRLQNQIGNLAVFQKGWRHIASLSMFFCFIRVFRVHPRTIIFCFRIDRANHFFQRRIGNCNVHDTACLRELRDHIFDARRARIELQFDAILTRLQHSSARDAKIRCTFSA